ncbi:MAG: hypothetical protein VYD11_02155 [Actinomycetota bacterium]|nr:hypothetical protein [Actinomycetota bacterium]MEC9424840.1 hypothetical protein [Actinomycetota bacterium]MED5220420.1 hypothetical protein [Actinomycetota bacterium]MED5233230.1 hypothetical protein [Actinomycetota bacterium]MED5394389.1 hypothetical protein [Actinomycetota bacterium]
MSTHLSLMTAVPSFAALTLDAVRTFLHLLGVAGWIGGQILMLGLLGVLRNLGPDVPRIAAVRFGKVAWPCFALAVTTGVWGLAEVGLSNQSDGYLATMLVKLFLVGTSGAAAAVHMTTRSPALRGASGGIGFLTALGALLAGAGLVT